MRPFFCCKCRTFLSKIVRAKHCIDRECHYGSRCPLSNEAEVEKYCVRCVMTLMTNALKRAGLNYSLIRIINQDYSGRYYCMRDSVKNLPVYKFRCTCSYSSVTRKICVEQLMHHSKNYRRDEEQNHIVLISKTVSVDMNNFW